MTVVFKDENLPLKRAKGLLITKSKNILDYANDRLSSGSPKKSPVISQESGENSKTDQSFSVVNIDLGVKTLIKKPEGQGNGEIPRLKKDLLQTFTFTCGISKSKQACKIRYLKKS